ncbi:MAG: hypothetical protein CBD74_12385 [Saprospirales bacterium TMED214]|nr:MAG: hypothetical protein CBD74_12385 [Saprospirales bacterium TMED214]
MHGPRSPFHRPFAPQKAFTLLEVIISISLGSILVMIAYASLDIASRLTRAGTENARQNGLARAVFQQIELGLRTETNNRHDYVEQYFPETEDVAKIAQSDQMPHSTVLGSEDVLFIRRLDHASASNAAKPDPKGYRPIFDFDAFFVTATGNYQQLQKSLRELGYRLNRQNSFGNQTSGLHRFRVALNTSDKTASVESVNWAFEKNEFKSMRFEYFDGDEWSDSWTFTENSPVAVRVLAEMNKNPDSIDDRSYRNDINSQHSITVRLPSSRITVTTN